MQSRCEFDVSILEKEVVSFAELTGDWNPLHTDGEYARTTEFGRPIAHGGLLVGVVSRVLGMYIPGQRSLVLSIKVRFPKPLFYPAQARVTGELKDFDEERSTGRVHVRVVDLGRAWCVLEGDVLFALHSVTEPNGTPEARSIPLASTAPRRSERPAEGDRRRLLVTGGTGGIGSRILPVLAEQYDICCLTRSMEATPACPAIEYERVDIECDEGLGSFLDRRGPDEFYGIVHLSAPPVPRVFVSDDIPAVRRHLRHGVEVPITLARWARRPPSSVKRVLLFGSTAGLKSPRPNMGAYSLGKAALEHLPRLLIADLSAQRATVNVIVPSAVPVGINEGMPERSRRVLMGRIPTGRLVETHDIAQVVLFLLSDAASQINGTTIAVDGGLAE